MKEAVTTSDAPAAVGPYSQAVVAGDLVLASGQIGLTPEGKLVTETIEQETHQVMHNLKAVLEAAGVGFEQVVSARIYLTDMVAFKQVNEVYASYFAGIVPPARETVGVTALPLGAHVEVSMTAVKAG